MYKCCNLISSTLLKVQAATSAVVVLLKARSSFEDVSLSAGPEAVEAQCQRLEVRSKDGGKLLFTATEEEVIMTTEKFIITGKMFFTVPCCMCTVC